MHKKTVLALAVVSILFLLIFALGNAWAAERTSLKEEW
jgi:hypothetical protein